MKNCYTVKGSIFDDSGLSKKDAKSCKKKSAIMINVLRVIQSNIFKKSFILKTLDIKKSYLKDIEDGEIDKLSLKLLQKIQPKVKKLLNFIELLKS